MRQRFINILGVICLLLASKICIAEVNVEEQPKSKEPSSIARFINRVDADPQRVSQVRGNDSIVQELNIGPVATEFWKKIQNLAADLTQIQDFSKLIALFELTVTDPVDSVSPRLPGVQQRNDIKGNPNPRILRQVGYGISRDPYNKRERVVKFILAFDLNQICLGSGEIRRVYGDGIVAIEGHSPKPEYFYKQTAGLRFSEAYGANAQEIRRAPLVFTYANSGCLDLVEFQQAVR
jgi:hypothetical protein